MPKMSLMRTFSIILTAVALAGCSSLPYPVKEQASAPVQLTNAQNLAPIPDSTRRVLMLPVYATQAVWEAQRDLDFIFREEMNKLLRFEVVSIGRQEFSAFTQKEQIASTEEIPAEIWAALKQKYAADAILFTDVTSYRPYRPISMGVRAKLIDANTLTVLWAVDSTLDSANESVAKAAREYGEPGDSNARATRSQLTLLSPRRFAAFTASQVYATLPKR